MKTYGKKEVKKLLGLANVNFDQKINKGEITPDKRPRKDGLLWEQYSLSPPLQEAFDLERERRREKREKEKERKRKDTAYLLSAVAKNHRSPVTSSLH